MIFNHINPTQSTSRWKTLYVPKYILVGVGFVNIFKEIFTLNVLCWTYKLCQRLPPLPLPIKFRGVRKILNQLGFWCCVLCLQPAPAKAQLLYQLIVWNYSWCKIFQTPRNFIGGGSGGNLWHNLYVQQSTWVFSSMNLVWQLGIRWHSKIRSTKILGHAASAEWREERHYTSSPEKMGIWLPWL